MDTNFGKPFTFSSSDSIFLAGIEGRIKCLAVRLDRLSNKKTIDFSIQLLRLNFSGNAINQKFTCSLQLCFSHRYVSSTNSLVQNNLFLRGVLRYYSPNKSWLSGFGQTKFPGNCQKNFKKWYLNQSLKFKSNFFYSGAARDYNCKLVISLPKKRSLPVAMGAVFMLLKLQTIFQGYTNT